jgi:hypothetical protein
VTALLLALMLTQPAGAPLVEVDPIRCWWRTSHGAVAVGQPFTLVLTCAVLENDSVRVIPDESPLAVGSVQLAPFELVGGSHPADLRSGQRRFFQYDYTLRIIDPTAIGRDVKLSDMQIHYRVESRVQSQSLEGRDRVYVLPPQSIRVTSTVPADAADIRDASSEPFGRIEALRFRARVLDIAAMALAALGAVILVPPLLRALVGAKQRGTLEAAAVSDRAILGRVAAELDAVQSEARAGWSPELAARALPAVRIVAGYALDRPPRQRRFGTETEPRDGRGTQRGSRVGDPGRLVVRRRGLRERRVAVASPTTTEDLTRALEDLPLTTAHARRSLLEEVRNALAALDKAAYSAGGAGDRLDDVVAAARLAAEQLRRDYGWMKTQLVRLQTRT